MSDKNKVGRPKLANKAQKKNAMITLVMAFVIVIFLSVCGTFTIFGNSNLAKTKGTASTSIKYIVLPKYFGPFYVGDIKGKFKVYTSSNAKVTLTSSNPSVLTVKQYANNYFSYECKKTGTVKVTAKTSFGSTVQNYKVTSGKNSKNCMVSYPKFFGNFYVGDTIGPFNVYGCSTVSVTSSNPSVIKVSGNSRDGWKLNILKKGTATIYAKSGGYTSNYKYTTNYKPGVATGVLQSPVDSQAESVTNYKKGLDYYSYYSKTSTGHACGSGKTLYRSDCTWHGGNDINVTCGTTVYATDGGKVTYLSTDTYNSGMGKTIGITSTYNGKKYLTLYQHLKTIYISKRDNIAKGQKIALSGDTGGYPCHLHLEIVKGDISCKYNGSSCRKASYRVNPYDYIAGSKKNKNYFTK